MANAHTRVRWTFMVSKVIFIVNFDISVVGAHNFMWQVCFQVSSNCNVKHILKIFFNKNL